MKLSKEVINGTTYQIEVREGDGKFIAEVDGEATVADTLKALKEKLQKLSRQRLGEGIPVTIAENLDPSRGIDKENDARLEDAVCVGLHASQGVGLYRNLQGQALGDRYNNQILRRLSAAEAAELQKLRREKLAADQAWHEFIRDRHFDARKAVKEALAKVPAGPAAAAEPKA